MNGIEKRRSPRIVLENGAQGRLKAVVPVTVRDVSGDGMQLELATSLRPGSTYDLTASVDGISLAAQIRITRCCASGYLPDGKGGNFLVFRAGAEFVRLAGDRIEEFRLWVERRTVSGLPVQLTPALGTGD